MQKISSQCSHPLFTVAATRRIEQLAAAALPPHTLMQRAGLATARLALALAPHAQCIWIACGPGNNGGDGFEAALRLHQWGKTVVVSWTGTGSTAVLPADAQTSRARALAAGVPMADRPPEHFDFCIDALLGIGATLDAGRPTSDCIQQWLALMHRSSAPCLAIDVPTGLNADTGQGQLAAIKSIATNVQGERTAATFTLNLLTLKPGSFTAQGRDLAGEVWFDALGHDGWPAQAPDAWLLGADRAAASPRRAALHASHKGSFGDVAVLGGESTQHSHMAGAALLAGRAALHAGAGRVFVALLAEAGESSLTMDAMQPELMFCSPETLDLGRQVVVCGCGGGSAIRAVLARVLSLVKILVLDADALNAIAADTQFQLLLRARATRDYITVLTPHPLEAARLLGSHTTEVQADRLEAARKLAARYQCVVVLKGSGTVIAAPAQTSCINASGNALLASAGTGDVLAGMVGAWLAGGLTGFDAACGAVFAHGRRAEAWAAERPGQPLLAGALAAFSPTPSGRFARSEAAPVLTNQHRLPTE